MSSEHSKESIRRSFIEHIFNTFKEEATRLRVLKVWYYEGFIAADCFDDLPGNLKQLVLCSVNYEIKKDPKYWPIPVKYPDTTMYKEDHGTYSLRFVEGPAHGVLSWKYLIFDTHPPKYYGTYIRDMECIEDGRIRMVISHNNSWDQDNHTVPFN